MFLLAAVLLLTHPAGVVAVLLVAAASLGLIGMATSPVGPGNNVLTPRGAFTDQAAASLLAGPFVAIGASGAVAPHLPGRYIITKAGVAALTLAAPIAGLEDGILIEITSSTAFAHTLTATGLLRNGTANVNLATFAAFDGASLLLCGYNGKWYVQAAQGVTIG